MLKTALQDAVTYMTVMLSEMKVYDQVTQAVFKERQRALFALKAELEKLK